MIDVTSDPEARLQASTMRVGYRCVLALSGELDASTVAVLRRALTAVLLSGEPDVWIDLTGLTYLDQAGVHVVVEARDELDGAHRKLSIIAPDGPARSAIEGAGLAPRLPLFSTRHDAHHRS